MTLAEIVIGNPDWIAPVTVIVAVAFLLLWRTYRRQNARRGLRVFAASLKAAGIVLLAICLIEPLRSGTRARPGANLLLIVADNSRSMRLSHAATGSNEGGESSLKTLLNDDKSDWQRRLTMTFELRRFLVDERIVGTESFSGYSGTGAGSRLHAALEMIRTRYRKRPVAGVLLFTDGIATDLPAAKFDVSGLPPIFPVLPQKRKTPHKDIAIQTIAVSQTSFEDAPVTVRGIVAVIGYRTKTIRADLLDEEGKTVQTHAQIAGSDDVAIPFDFRLKPKKRGLRFYRLRVGAADEWSQFVSGKPVSEITLANNERLLKVQRGRKPRRVLYVAGRPNWEFKFLNRAVEEDPHIHLAALIRIARREAKFQFRGRRGESSNPLFRGFKKQADAETERFDEPVFARLNMKDAAELRSGFPKTKQELYKFDAIILDDVEAAFFRREQLSLLRTFVSERGGGVLWLGGRDSFRSGGYQHTPVAEMLPVDLNRRLQQRTRGAVRLTLSREGWLQPWTRLRADEVSERARLKRMPSFRTLNRLAGVKPGAMVAAYAVDAQGKRYPAVAVQRYGRGRAAAVMIGDLWRWGLERKTEKSDLAKSWRQLVRWIVADVPDRVECRVSSISESGASGRRLSVTVCDREYRPLDDARVRLTVVPPDGKPIPLSAEPSDTVAGLYETTFYSSRPGTYHVRVEVEDADGKPIAIVENGWTHEPAADEFRRVTPDRQWCEEIARRSGGRVLSIGDLDQFSRELPTHDVPVTEPWSIPIWHQWWFLTVALCCFVSEWGIRRWKGLS